jgi:tetratricopeptide (TPR) repeat protein
MPPVWATGSSDVNPPEEEFGLHSSPLHTRRLSLGQVSDENYDGSLSDLPGKNHSATQTTKPSLTRRTAVVLIVISSVLVAGCVGELIGHLIRGSTSPSSLASERQIGLSDAASGYCAKAESLLVPVVATDSSDMAAEKALGDCQLQMHQYNSAVLSLGAVAAFQRELPNEIALANAAFFSGNISLVDSSLKAAIALFTTSSDDLAIAQSAQSYGLYTTSARALNDVRPSMRNYVWYEVEAQTQLELGYPVKAVVDAEHLAKLAPASVRSAALMVVGGVYESVGKDRSAVRAFREAIVSETQNDEGSIYGDLSQCYIVLGEYSAALRSTQLGVASASGPTLFSVELDEATALADVQHPMQSVAVLRHIIDNPSAPANTVASASALLSTIEG